MNWHALPPAAKRAHACAQIWRRGRPTLLLDPGQRGWVQRLDARDSHAVWCIGRQRGKSFAALAYACEVALRQPGSIIRYAAKTKDTARQIVVHTLEQLLEWCEEPNRPEVDEAHATVRWKNGSVLTWAGTDAQSFDRLRGPRAHLIFLDESAFYQDLEHVEAALLPQLTTTGGKAVYLSTPPESLGHPFIARFRAAQASGTAEHETLDDNPRLTPEQKSGILRRFAETHGMTQEQAQQSTFWRREYLAQFVTEESRAALPGWNDELAKRIVVESKRPQHFNGYVSLDWGFGDGHGALFGYYDFERARMVIEDAVAMRGKTLAQWVEIVKAKERELWGVDKYNGTLWGAKDWGHGIPEFLRTTAKENAPRQPYLRVGDDQMLVLAEVAITHGMAVLPTKKDNKHMAVDALDQAMRRGEYEINPRATQLIRQLYTTTWNRTRTEWERTADGHGEAVDCLCYLHRNLNRHIDPRPARPVDPFKQYMVDEEDGSTENQWRRALGF